MPKPLLRLAAILVLCFAVFAEADDFSSATQALKANDASTAERLLVSWIAENEKAGVYSAEAHHNLGLAYWALKRPAPSVYHLLKSTTYRASPWKRLATLNSLSEIEKDLGIRDGVAGRTDFKVQMLIEPNFLLVLVTIGFWGLVVAFLMWWLQGERALRAAKQTAILPSILLVTGLLGYGYHGIAMRVGVLDGEPAGIPVFRLPEEKADNKLLDLPGGTIVSSGRTQNDLTEIYEPIAGWVPTKTYRAIR